MAYRVIGALELPNCGEFMKIATPSSCSSRWHCASKSAVATKIDVRIEFARRSQLQCRTFHFCCAAVDV